MDKHKNISKNKIEMLAIRCFVGPMKVGLYLGNDILEAHQSLSRADWKRLRDPTIEYPKDDTFHIDRLNYAMRAFEVLQKASVLIGVSVHAVRVTLRQKQALSSIIRRGTGGSALPTLNDRHSVHACISRAGLPKRWLTGR
jgi:hypothetical protein